MVVVELVFGFVYWAYDVVDYWCVLVFVYWYDVVICFVYCGVGEIIYGCIDDVEVFVCVWFEVFDVCEQQVCVVD